MTALRKNPGRKKAVKVTPHIVARIRALAPTMPQKVLACEVDLCETTLRRTMHHYGIPPWAEYRRRRR